MGVETEEVNQQMVVSEKEPDHDETEDNSELTQLSNTTSHYDSRESSTSGDQSSQSYSGELPTSSCGDQSNSSSHKRREKLDETLATYKHKKVKKRMPANVQMLQLAEKELELKQQMAERVDAMSKDHKESMVVVTDNLKACDTKSSAISLLHQLLMQQRSSPSMPPYHNMYTNMYVPPPSPTLPGSPAPTCYHHSPSMPTPAADTRSSNYDEYTQEFLDKDC